MIYGSVCSGIEAASVAWEGLGWRAAFLSEIEPFPRAVLRHRFPTIPLHGDFTTIGAGDYEPIDLLVGGTPCQSFSVAGLRGGLDDARGNLALEYLRLAARLRPRWLVWENVPGVLSSVSHAAPDPCPPPPPVDLGCDGAEMATEDDYGAEELHAFNCLLAGFSDLGYGWAYRVLNAQHFGVPQRRRRVFVVGYLGDWRRAAAVLFERHSLSWHSAPRRSTGEGVAPALRTQSQSSHRADSETFVADYAPTLSASYGEQSDQDLGVDGALVAKCLSASHTASGRLDPTAETFITHALTGEGFDANEDGTGRGTPLIPITFGWQNSASQGDSVSVHVTPTLDKSKTPAISFALRGRDGGALPEINASDAVGALRSAAGGSSRDYVEQRGVRRLTVRECERLQGFPDGWTDVPFRGKPAADGPRYRAIGNSMAVPCMRWLGERIQLVEDHVKNLPA